MLRVTNEPLLGRFMTTERNKMKKVAIVIAVLVAVFVGVGGIPLAKVRDIGAIPSALVGSYTLGVFLLTSLGGSAVSYALKRREAA